MSDSSESVGTPHPSLTAMSISSAPNMTVPIASPMSILRSPASESWSSLASGPSSPNISFAPLPSIKPRKRHGTLGVAARSSLLRQRSASTPDMRQAQEDGFTRPTMYMRQGIIEEEEEDPFTALAQLLSDAGRKIWRKVSHKDGERLSDGEKSGRKRRVQDTELRVDRMMQYTVKEDEGDGEGGVWEEEVGGTELETTKQVQLEPKTSAVVGDVQVTSTITAAPKRTKKKEKEESRKDMEDVK